MSQLVFSEATLDDLMRAVMQAVDHHGEHIHPGKGPAQELAGVLLELRDPRARLSRTETRGKVFSCLGELCWYLAGSEDLAFIEFYLSKYRKFARDGVVCGAYGPRLFDWDGINQVQNAIERLKSNPQSRRAVIQLFDAQDLPSGEKEIPCTCTLQFLARRGLLHLLVMMRSNDIVLGLPHDVFCFTMLQEIAARSLSADVGWYRHSVGSLHIYDRDQERVDAFLNEGWQPTTLPMPPMPVGDPWLAVQDLLDAESRIRGGKNIPTSRLAAMDPYWADLARLLMVHAAARLRDSGAISKLRNAMAFSGYHTYIDARTGKL